MKNNNIATFAEQVEEEFIRLYRELKVDDAPARRKADIIDTIWTDIYSIVFKPGPDHVPINNAKSKLKTWDVENMEAVTEVFIKLNKRYGGVIKKLQFSNLTGIHRSTFSLWHKENKTNGCIFSLSNTGLSAEYSTTYVTQNSAGAAMVNNIALLDKHRNDGVLSPIRFDSFKRLEAEMQDSNTNALSMDTYGHMYRANNEPELGKLYEPRRVVFENQVKNVLTDSDLVKVDLLPDGETAKSLDIPDILGIE